MFSDSIHDHFMAWSEQLPHHGRCCCRRQQVEGPSSMKDYKSLNLDAKGSVEA
jgi:hypothetical protein